MCFLSHRDDLFFCNTFHLYQPSRLANLGLDDDMGNLGIELLHHLLYCVVVGEVTEIDDEVLDVVHRGTSVFEQSTDVLQESARLSYDVSLIHHLTMLVDAGCSRDEIYLLVWQGETSATLEGYTIFMGRVQVVERL